MRNIREATFAFFALIFSVAAQAQTSNQPVYQSGLVTPGHAPQWLQNGVVGDAGGAAGGTVLGSGYLTELGITNTGTPFCINDALITSFSGYHQFCLGSLATISGNAGAFLTYNAYGGATPQSIYLNLNGVNYPLAFPSVNGLPEVASETALAAEPSTFAAIVVRKDYAIGNGAPPVFYTPTSSPCSFNGGAGDGGLQVPASDGGCWIAQFNGPADIREWGALAEAAGGYVAVPVNPAGTYDSTAAINAACATGLPLWAPEGRFHVTNMISCAANLSTGAGHLQAILDVGSDFNLSASGVLNVAPSAASTQAGAEINNLGIQCYQNPADTSFSQLVQYPWAIIGTTPPARPILGNINISRCWNGISFSGDFAPIFNGITQLGAFNTPLLIDGALDYTFIDQMEIWPFGTEGSSNLSAIWAANPPNAQIGRVDGLKVGSLAFFDASLTVLSDNNFVTGQQYANLHFNGPGSGMTVLGGNVQIANLALDTSTAPGLTVNGNFDGTVVEVGSCKCIFSGSNEIIQVHGGVLNIGGGLLESGTSSPTGPLVVVDGTTAASRLLMSNMELHLNSGNLTAPLIEQSGTGTGLSLIGLHTGAAPGGSTGTIVAIQNDTAQNYLADLDFLQWGHSTVSVNFGASGVLGYYDLPSVQFPASLTPRFSTPGDFAPIGNTTTGYFKVLGGQVCFTTEDTFASNAYTTPTGNFSFGTNFPTAAVANIDGVMQTPITLGRTSNVTFTTAASVGAELDYTNPPTLLPIQIRTGVAWAGLGTSNITAGTSGFDFDFSGCYPIR